MESLHQKITSSEIRKTVKLALKDIDHSPTTASILSYATSEMIARIEEEAGRLAKIQGRNFITKRDFLLASRILGIVK